MKNKCFGKANIIYKEMLYTNIIFYTTPMCLGCGVVGALWQGGAGTLKDFSEWFGGLLLSVPETEVHSAEAAAADGFVLLE